MSFVILIRERAEGVLMALLRVKVFSVGFYDSSDGFPLWTLFRVFGFDLFGFFQNIKTRDITFTFNL